MAGVDAVKALLPGILDIRQAIPQIHAPLFFAQGLSDQVAIQQTELAMYLSSPLKPKVDNVFFGIANADHDTILSNAHNANLVAHEIEQFVNQHLPVNQIIQDMTMFAPSITGTNIDKGVHPPIDALPTVLTGAHLNR